jgi:beta-N-acetylhexosaminidase
LAVLVAVGGAFAVLSVWVVKDTQRNLPLRPETHRRVRLYGITGHADFTGTDPTGFLQIAREELERAGFEVYVFKNADQRIAAGEAGITFHGVLREEATEAYPEQYDAAIVFANVSGFAQDGTIRIHWSSPMAAEIPWYATEVPTIFVSLSLPNHLIDVPMVKTMIHAYAPSREAIRATVEKIQGKSPFQGTFNENVFCETFGTRR